MEAVDYTEGAVPVPIRLVEAVFERYPEWKHCVGVPLPAQPEDTLEVIVPSRFAPHCPLKVEAEGVSITVRWGNWDEHCDPWAGMHSDDESIAAALKAIDDILSDRLVVMDIWEDGRLRMSLGIAPEQIDEYGRTWACDSGAHFTVRSWSGQHDRGTMDPAKLDNQMTEEEMLLFIAELENKTAEDGV